MARRKGAAPPVHPFDAAHGVETGGLIPAGDLVTGHSSDAHVTAYYGVAPSILRGLVELWAEARKPWPGAGAGAVQLCRHRRG